WDYTLDENRVPIGPILEQVGKRQQVVDAKAAPDGSLAASRRIPRKRHARREVLRSGVEIVGAENRIRRSQRRQVRGSMELLVQRSHIFIAQSEADLQIGTHGDLILRIESKICLAD